MGAVLTKTVADLRRALVECFTADERSDARAWLTAVIGSGRLGRDKQ